MSLALELIDAEITRLIPPDVAARIEALKAERKRIAAFVKGDARPEPMRVETVEKTTACGPLVGPTPKSPRKPRAARGSGETIGARILAFLQRHQTGENVGNIASVIEAEKRSVSYTLQNLKKAGKVVRDGDDWFITDATLEDLRAGKDSGAPGPGFVDEWSGGERVAAE